MASAANALYDSARAEWSRCDAAEAALAIHDENIVHRDITRCRDQDSHFVNVHSLLDQFRYGSRLSRSRRSMYERHGLLPMECKLYGVRLALVEIGDEWRKFCTATATATVTTRFVFSTV